MSPWEASIDMDGGERCWSHAAGKHTDLNHYYDSWLSDNLVHDFDKDETESDYTALNMYLQTYKSVWGVPKLRGYTEPMSGTKKLPGLTPVVDGRNVTAAPMAVFEGETDNGVFNGCGTKDRYKSFIITVNGNVETFTLYDPWDSEWILKKTSEPTKDIIIGPGGRIGGWAVAGDILGLTGIGVVLGFAVKAIAVAVANPVGATVAGSIAGSVLIESIAYYGFSSTSSIRGSMSFSKTSMMAVQDAVQEAKNNPPAASGEPADTSLPDDVYFGSDKVYDASEPDAVYFEFDKVYNEIQLEEREACILGQNIAWNYECLVVGTSIVIQGDGKALAVPLPNLYRGWK